MTRNLGDMAESELMKWISQTGITANKAYLDREGWDFILQFPFSELERDIPLDRRVSRIECWIQVKGRETTKRNKSIKLSNWEKLIRSPLPAFFLIIDFGKEDDPRNAYLVHVGEEWINKVLRRLRKLRSDDATKLHKKTLDLTWGEKERISSLGGKGLSNAIQKHIPDGMENYERWKMAIREQVGDPIPALLHISTAFESDNELWTRWVDFIIGIREEMPFTDALLEEDVRFDIPSKASNLGQGTFKYKPNSLQEGRIIFRDDSNTRRAVFKAQFYSPYGFFSNNPIPQQYIRERARFEFGNVTIWPHTGEVNVNFRFKLIEKTQSLRVYANLCRLLNILQFAAQDGCVLEIQDQENKGLTSGSLMSLSASQLNPELMELAQALDDIWFISRILEVPLEEKVSTDQILSQLGMLRLLRQICDVNIPIDSFTSNIIAEELTNKEMAIPFVRKILFGEFVYVISTAVAGQPIFSPGENPKSYAVQIDNLRRVYLEHFSVKKDAVLSKDEIVDDLVAKLEDKGFDVLLLP